MAKYLYNICLCVDVLYVYDKYNNPLLNHPSQSSFSSKSCPTRQEKKIFFFTERGRCDFHYTKRLNVNTQELTNSSMTSLRADDWTDRSHDSLDFTHSFCRPAVFSTACTGRHRRCLWGDFLSTSCASGNTSHHFVDLVVLPCADTWARFYEDDIPYHTVITVVCEYHLTMSNVLHTNTCTYIYKPSIHTWFT